MRYVTCAVVASALLGMACAPDSGVGSTGAATAAGTTTSSSGAPTSGGCTPGTEGCECIDDALCVAGLVCLSSLCVDATGPSSASGPTDGDSSDSTGTTGITDGESDAGGTSEGTTSDGPYCGDGVVQGSEECDDGKDETDNGCEKCAFVPRLVFASKGIFDIPFSIIGADKTCHNQAGYGDLPNADKFKAWISFGDSSPSTRFDTDFIGPYVLVDGTVVVRAGWVDLTDGTLEHGINLDQDGLDLNPYNIAWTGTLPNGTPAANNCNDWQISEAGKFTPAGDPLSNNGTWTEGLLTKCSSLGRFYCFEDRDPMPN
jgi:hypothetical protein